MPRPVRSKVFLAIAALLLSAAAADRPSEARLTAEREAMVATVAGIAARAQVKGASRIDPRVLAAMRAGPRPRRVPTHEAAGAYDNPPQPNGHQQTN